MDGASRMARGLSTPAVGSLEELASQASAWSQRTNRKQTLQYEHCTVLVPVR